MLAVGFLDGQLEKLGQPHGDGMAGHDGEDAFVIAVFPPFRATFRAHQAAEQL